MTVATNVPISNEINHQIQRIMSAVMDTKSRSSARIAILCSVVNGAFANTSARCARTKISSCCTMQSLATPLQSPSRWRNSSNCTLK